MTAQSDPGQAATGAALAALFAADPHPPGGADAALLGRRVVVTRANHDALYQPPAAPTPNYVAGSRPALERLVAELLAAHTEPIPRANALARYGARLARATAMAARTAPPGSLRCGGAEEAILTRGHGTAAEVARLGCALAQVAGLHARVVFLADDDPPERHTLIEVFLWGRWSVVDTWSGRLFVWPKHRYAGAWDIHLLPQLVDQHPDHGRQHYVASRFYRHVAIAAADVAERYDERETPLPMAVVERLAQRLGG